MAARIITNKVALIIFSLLILISLYEFFPSASSTQDVEEKRPNILFILADDLGYSDIASFGGEISTPNLDVLAAGGIKMSNLYAASACSPTRSMLLGGTSSHKAGMGTMYNDQTENQLGQPGYEGYLNNDVVTVSTLLQDAGYHTYMTG
ncbi:MAG: sulfatase-like hydrolase/transferase, partial [Emcibacteraceae bacterium]|nr:sulfatase-like hydrolase/transferase [Emcibacteraceae bacterium]